MPRRPFRPRRSYAPTTYHQANITTAELNRRNQLSIQAFEYVLQARNFKSLLHKLRKVVHSNAKFAVEYYFHLMNNSIAHYHRLLQEDSTTFDDDPNGEAFFDEIFQGTYSQILRAKLALTDRR